MHVNLMCVLLILGEMLSCSFCIEQRFLIMMERIVRVAGRRDHNAENVHFFAVDTRYYYVNKISFWY